jgi:CubicO group peptidase (beta-lactamase class C family)
VDAATIGMSELMGKARHSFVPFLLAVPLLFVVHCKHAPSGPDASVAQPEETGDGWETATLGSVGMDQGPFVDLIQRIESGAYGEVHSVVVVKNNRLVFERYWAGHDFAPFATNYLGTYTRFDRNTRHDTHSATKSFVSALVGIALDHGQIESRGDAVFKYLPSQYEQWKSQGRERITVEHCLMMASGLQWNEWEAPVTASENDLMVFIRSSDPIGYLLSKPVITEPGTRFYYNGGTVNLLGVMLAFASDQSVQSFSSRYLFGPLGISNYNWQVLQPSGLTFCSGDIYITPRDMAKFGQLFLNEGKWNGTQIVSKEWVMLSTQNHINPPVSWADGYGYLWWLRNLRVNNKTVGSFKAIGWGGQEIFILKDLAMVVVFTGANYVSNVPCDEIMQRYILPSAGM